MRIACHFCGLSQIGRELREGERGRCARCGSTISHRKISSISRTLVWCICGLILFLPANAHSVLTFTAFGRWNDSRLMTGIHGLYEDEAYIVGSLVLIASILAPLALFICGVALLLPIQLGLPRLTKPGLQKVFESLGHWAMLDVYLLAVIVAYAKLSNFGDSSLNPGLYLLLGLIAVSLLVAISYDSEAVTRALSTGDTTPHAHGHRKNLHATEAFLITAAILLVPSYMLPVLRLVEYGEVHQDTVYGAVLELTSGGQYVLGVLMFCASIIVPIMKLLILVFLTVSVRLRWTILKRERLMLYKIVETIGRWSFVDLFVISILIALAELGVFATATPGPGLVFFATVVVLTMFAAMNLDPRLIWVETETDHARTVRA